MLSYAIYVLSFVFVLGVLVFVHELGHFLAAKRVGIHVLKFQLGFNPTILSFRFGETEYGIGALPLGGYVKMAGENPEDTRTGADDEFLSKGKWQRFQVLVMGPIMNILLAVVVMAVVLYQGAQVPAYEQQAVVIGSFAENSVGAQAGLKLGDRIVTVDGKPVDNWDDFGDLILTRAKREVSLGVVRDGHPVQIAVVPAAQTKYELGDIGVKPVIHPQIQDVSPGQPAAAAGLQKGDIVLGVGAVNGISYEDLIKTIRASENKPLDFHVKRGESLTTITVTPRRHGDQAMVGANIQQLETRTVNPGPLEAVKLSIQKNYEWAKMIFQTVAGLFTHETSVKQLMGPVAIADLSGTAAHAGWIPLFSLMAMISLNLGLLNLMPIPVLDGGHIFILALEGLARRDFSTKVKEKMLLGGFVLLLMLMATVIYNDLMRIQWIEKLVPWR